MGRLGKSFEFFKVKHYTDMDCLLPKGVGTTDKLFKFDAHPSHKSWAYVRDDNGKIVKRSFNDCNVYNMEDRSTESYIHIEKPI